MLKYDLKHVEVQRGQPHSTFVCRAARGRAAPPPLALTLPAWHRSLWVLQITRNSHSQGAPTCRHGAQNGQGYGNGALGRASCIALGAAAIPARARLGIARAGEAVLTQNVRNTLALVAPCLLLGCLGAARHLQRLAKLIGWQRQSPSEGVLGCGPAHSRAGSPADPFLNSCASHAAWRLMNGPSAATGPFATWLPR